MLKIRVVEKPVEIEALIRTGEEWFGDLVKGVVDVEKLRVE